MTSQAILLDGVALGERGVAVDRGKEGPPHAWWLSGEGRSPEGRSPLCRHRGAGGNREIRASWKARKESEREREPPRIEQHCRVEDDDLRKLTNVFGKIEVISARVTPALKREVRTRWRESFVEST